MKNCKSERKFLTQRIRSYPFNSRNKMESFNSIKNKIPNKFLDCVYKNDIENKNFTFTDSKMYKQNGFGKDDHHFSSIKHKLNNKKSIILKEMMNIILLNLIKILLFIKINSKISFRIWKSQIYLKNLVWKIQP